MTSAKDKPGTTQQNPQTMEISAEELLQGHREICIVHGDVRYRLRITRRHKLILQK
jgi:hemin uptake protein HemP